MLVKFFICNSLFVDAKTNELSELLSISPLTIRCDLQSLEEDGIVRRFYGGVSIADNSNDSLAPDENPVSSAIKQAFAKYAATLVNDGDTIFINSSSTALLILEYLEEKDVEAITINSSEYIN